METKVNRLKYKIKTFVKFSKSLGLRKSASISMLSVIALILILFTNWLVQKQTMYGKAQTTSSPNFYFNQLSTSLPPNRTVSLYFDATTSNSIGFVRAEVLFDRSKLNLSGEVIPTTDRLSRLIKISSRSEANSTGKIVVVLGLLPNQTAPTGSFKIADIPLTAITTLENQTTSIAINNTDTEVVRLDETKVSFTSGIVTVTLNPTSSPTPTFAPTPTSTSGSTPTPTPTSTTGMISNLYVRDTTNAGDWFVQQNLQAGNLQYGDRSFTFTSVPLNYRGSEWIRTANDSKSSTLSTVVSFRVNKPARVYVAHDDRITTKPSWLSQSSGWTNTGEDLINSESTTRRFSLFVKNYSSGQTVYLGPNGSSTSGTSMYTVVVKEADFITNMVVQDSNNASAWSIKSNIQPGNLQYGDRSFTLATVPSLLVGSDWIQTANSSKSYTSNPLVTFKVSNNTYVYVAHDNRISTKPSWLSSGYGWTDTGQDLINNESGIRRPFSIYVKSYSAGATVSLGPNSGSALASSMYTIIVKKR